MPELNPWPYPRIVAHRGGGKLAPENTLAAIDCGHKHGHTMIEFDVKLSQDKQAFLLHDDDLQRTTDHQGIAGEMRWQQLSQVDAGAWFDSRFQGEALPLLSEVAQRCRDYNMWANIEIKPTTGQEQQTGAQVAKLAKSLWPSDMPPLLSSFSIEALAAAQHAEPELPRGLLLDEWVEHWQALVETLDCVAIHLNHRLLTEARVQQLKAANLRILAYTVNQADRARELLGWGVDMICTDRIDVIGPDFQ